MSGQKPCGWITPTGQLFPLSAYNPDRPSQYDGHKAGWEYVYRGEKSAAPITLTPAMRADAAAIGASGDPMSLEVGDPS